MTEGWAGEGVPDWVGGMDRGQIIWGSLCPGREGTFYLKYITKHVKHGMGMDRSNLSVKIIIPAAAWRRAWRGPEGK